MRKDAFDFTRRRLILGGGSIDRHNWPAGKPAGHRRINEHAINRS
jgi:hypothetical protein